jgi:hypothetical protein
MFSNDLRDLLIGGSAVLIAIIAIVYFLNMTWM